MSEGLVLVVGSLNVDLVVRVARLPAPGETVAGSDLGRTPGGKGLNQAVAAARAGARVTMLGAVGDDEPGRWLRDLAAEEGIEVAGVATVARPTGTAVVLLEDGGANAIVVSPGANAAVSTVGVAARGLRCAPADVVVCQGEVPVEVVDAALGSAHGAGATTVLNQAPFRPLSDTQWACTDVLVVNESELDALLVEEAGGPTGAATPEGPDGGPGVRAQAMDRAERLLSMRRRAGLSLPASVVVSLGAAGAVVVDPDGGRAEVVAPEVVAVDTVGAGDCLVGWLAAGLLDRPAGSSGVVSALGSAVRAAALSVQRPGAAASMPFAAEVP